MYQHSCKYPLSKNIMTGKLYPELLHRLPTYGKWLLDLCMNRDTFYHNGAEIHIIGGLVKVDAGDTKDLRICATSDMIPFGDCRGKYHVIDPAMKKEEFTNLLDYLTCRLHKVYTINYGDIKITLGMVGCPSSVGIGYGEEMNAYFCGMIEKYDSETVDKYIQNSVRTFEDHFSRCVPDEFDDISLLAYRRFYKSQLGEYLTFEYDNIKVVFGQGSGYNVDIYDNDGKHVHHVLDEARRGDYERVNRELFDHLVERGVTSAECFADVNEYRQLYAKFKKY